MAPEAASGLGRCNCPWAPAWSRSDTSLANSRPWSVSTALVAAGRPATGGPTGRSSTRPLSSTSGARAPAGAPGENEPLPLPFRRPERLPGGLGRTARLQALAVALGLGDVPPAPRPAARQHPVRMGCGADAVVLPLRPVQQVVGALCPRPGPVGDLVPLQPG